MFTSVAVIRAGGFDPRTFSRGTKLPAGKSNSIPLASLNGWNMLGETSKNNGSFRWYIPQTVVSDNFLSKNLPLFALSI